MALKLSPVPDFGLQQRRAEEERDPCKCHRPRARSVLRSPGRLSGHGISWPKSSRTVQSCRLQETGVVVVEVVVLGVIRTHTVIEVGVYTSHAVVQYRFMQYASSQYITYILNIFASLKPNNLLRKMHQCEHSLNVCMIMCVLCYTHWT